MVCVDDLVEFIRDKFPAYDNICDEELSDIVATHIGFNTWDDMRDDGRVIAVVRYNILGHTARVLDLGIEEGYDGDFIIKRFIIRGLNRFPYLKYIQFSRQYKYPLRKDRIYSIKKLLKIKEN